MKQSLKIVLGILSSGLLCGVSSADSVSTQIQMLNSQIQAQLQKMQADQQKQTQTMNAQVQSQLKQMQSDLQDQIKKSSSQSQSQLKQVQDGLQKEIQQVQKMAAESKK